jgi:hypothetical protein
MFAARMFSGMMYAAAGSIMLSQAGSNRQITLLGSILLFMAGFRARDAYNAWKLMGNDEDDK